MSGSNAGEEVWLQRNMIEEYTAPIIYKSIKKVYSFISDVGRCGDTLELILCRSTITLWVHWASKIFRDSR